MNKILKFFKDNGYPESQGAGNYVYCVGSITSYITLNVTDKVKPDILQELNFRYVFLCLVCDTNYLNILLKEDLEFYQYLFQTSWNKNKTLEVLISDIVNNLHRIDYKECEHIFTDYFLEEIFG